MRAKRLLDVEDVVRWAAGELSRKRRPGSSHREPLEVSRRDGELLGRFTKPADYPSIAPGFSPGFARGSAAFGVGAPPHEDALLVEAAIGELGAKMAGWPAPDELALDIGLPVDVDGAFAGALVNVGNLVTTYGRLGKRPPLAAESPRPGPKLAANGKPGVWLRQQLFEETVSGAKIVREYEMPAQRIRRDLYPTGAYCRLEWDPDPQMIVNDRAEYWVWRAALDQLCDLLAGQMSTIAALPAAAALAPWLGDRDGDRPVELFAPGAPRVYGPIEQMALEARRSARARRSITLSRARLRRPARPGRQATG